MKDITSMVILTASMICLALCIAFPGVLTAVAGAAVCAVGLVYHAAGLRRVLSTN